MAVVFVSVFCVRLLVSCCIAYYCKKKAWNSVAFDTQREDGRRPAVFVIQLKQETNVLDNKRLLNEQPPPCYEEALRMPVPLNRSYHIGL